VANRQLEIEKDSYSTARQLADLTEGQFKLGAAPETNAIRARIALTQEESNLMQAVNTVAAARAALDIAIGREAKEPIDAAEPLQFKPVNTSLADLRKLALVRRPEIQSAGHYLDAAKANVGLQRTQYLPDLFLATDLHAIHNGTFQVGFTMPLFDFGSIRGNVHQAEHTAEAQSARFKTAFSIARWDFFNGSSRATSLAPTRFWTSSTPKPPTDLVRTTTQMPWGTIAERL
jgi:outer membrane protein TolC